MSLLTGKINSIEAEVLSLGDDKANALFPTFTGTATFNGPVVLTRGATGLTPASVGLDKVQNIDAQAYTDGQITALTLHAPALLNTITELASAINNDPNYYTTITSQFATLNLSLIHI